MKLLIVISCILANGAHVQPRGKYHDWRLCNGWVDRFETETYASDGARHHLCWCHQVAEPMPLPERPIRYDETRKAPLP